MKIVGAARRAARRYPNETKVLAILLLVLALVILGAWLTKDTDDLRGVWRPASERSPAS